MRHAYLILAHNNFMVLEYLLRLLDHEQNDIYIHIDKKTSNFPKKKLLASVSMSKITIIQEVDIRWGDYSIVEAQLSLLKLAFQKRYDYYHFMSGSDLPTKPVNEILSFFELNKGKEFVHFVNDEYNSSVIQERVKYYQYFHKQRFGINKPLGRFVFRVLYRSSLIIQKFLRINRMEEGTKYMYGSNWSSFTHDFAAYILNQEERLIKMFTRTNCSDELYIQTLIYNSSFVKRLYYMGFDDDYVANQRNIIFDQEGKNFHPRIWRLEHKESLLQSERLFARKFDENKDMELVKWIYNKLICNKV